MTGKCKLVVALISVFLMAFIPRPFKSFSEDIYSYCMVNSIEINIIFSCKITMLKNSMSGAGVEPAAS